MQPAALRARDHWLFIFCLLVAAAVRASAFEHLPPWDWPNHYPYFDALREHLGEYVWFNSLKPPLTFLIHGFIAKTLGNGAIAEHNVPLLLTYGLDLIAAVLLYASAMRLSVNRHLAAVMLGVYSIAYLPFEHWYRGAHYDHHTLFFTALFAYCMCSVIREPRAHRYTALSCAAALLIAQSTVNALVVPVTLIVLVVVLRRRDGGSWHAALARLVYVIILPMLVLALLIAKNYQVASILATSNLAGTANMMVIASATDYDIVRLREIVVESKAPKWYLQCFDRAAAGAHECGEVEFPGWSVIFTASGICYPVSTTGWRPGREFWPHDLHGLRMTLQALGEDELVRIVDKDIADARERQYLFTGFGPEQSARWIGIFGNISVKIYRDFVLKHPWLFLKDVWNINKTFRSGAYYPQRMDGPNGVRSPELEHLDRIIVPAGFVYGKLVLLGFWLLLVGWMLLLIRAYFPSLHARLEARYQSLRNALSVHLRKSKQVGGDALPGRETGRGSSAVPAFMILSMPGILLSVIFSSQVGGENFRYFYQVTPYLLLIAMLFLDEIVKSPEIR